MVTSNQESVLLKEIKGLTELEFAALLTEMAEHMRKNDWSHIIDECFDVETYEDEVDELNKELEEKEDENINLNAKIDSALDLLDGLDHEDEDGELRTNIEVIIKTLAS